MVKTHAQWKDWIQQELKKFLNYPIKHKFVWQLVQERERIKVFMGSS